MFCLFLPHKQQRKGSICVSVIPYWKSQLLAGPLRVQAEEYSPWRIQPSFCVDFNRFATLQRFYMPLQVLSSRRQDWGEQHRSYKLLWFNIFHMSHHSTLRGIWFLNRFQKWWSPGSLSPPIGALPSSQGCQASSLALHSIGMVWPKQHGLATPSDMQSLQPRPPSIGSCRSARCWPGCLSDGKWPRLSRDLTLSH